MDKQMLRDVILGAIVDWYRDQDTLNLTAAQGIYLAEAIAARIEEQGEE